MPVLIQFVLRLSFGLALGMAVLSPRLVTSGFFRVHAYVLLGLNVLAALVAGSLDEYSLWPPVVAATLSYVASIVWLHEKSRVGIPLLGIISAVSLVGVLWTLPGVLDQSALVIALKVLAQISGGLVLGVTIAAMFLGHWYLNTPTMELGPLRRLVLLMAAALLLRALVSGTGLTLTLLEATSMPETWFLVLRWFSGILMPLGLAWMTWKTLDVPNTQSATGILYVGVITTFTGELTAQLLSDGAIFPL